MVLFNAYGRMVKASLKAAPLLCFRALKSMTGSGNLWMPNQPLCPLQSQNVQTPFHNICSNCLTWFLIMTWLFHNQGQNSSDGLKLGFVLSSSFTFLKDKCVFLKSPRRLHLFSPATYRTKRSLFSKFSMSHKRTPWTFLSNYLQPVIVCLDISV